MASLMSFTEYATNDSLIVNLDNIDLIRSAPFEGTRIYFMYADNLDDAEYVDVVENIDSIMADLEDLLDSFEDQEENDGQPG